ncbi:MAG: PD-(D/E)XK nuclease family protein, partial [Clostridia bacterium]|nr:PD-(D/E)XK nuclease family protein [Clostridia bacterium]
FRSAGNVISFVNRLFSKIMKPPVFGFDYADGHAMRGGSGYAEGYDGIAELCLYESDEKEKPKAESVYSVADAKGEVKRFSAEGKAVLRLIKEALNSEYYDPERAYVKDKDGNVRYEPERGVVKVQTGDICVLTRKKDNAAVQELVRVVSSEYPVASAAETNICDRPEIKKLLDVLSYIDNGEQDIPLAAALLSPVGGFTESELAAVRIFGGTGMGAPSFRECCRLYADKKENGIAEKLQTFFERIERFRMLSDSVGAARIIDEIMQTDNFSAVYNTQNKLSAVRRLQREAYTPSGELYLNAFLAKIKAGGNKVTAPSALASDCVKVMTMHASKGLEFPVVIIADIASTYEGQKVENIPFDDDFGFAPKYYDAKSRKSAKTALGKLYAARKVREEINNEINLFYVACTRAKYALHILSSKAENYNIVKAYTAKNYAKLFDVSSFDPRILPDESQESGNSRSNGRTLDESRADKSTLDLLEEISAYSYPYALGVELPVKSSASGILNAIAADENAQPLFDDEIMRDAKTGIDAGITYHRFLELCDFSAIDPDSIEKQIARWRSAGLITEAQYKTLDRGQLANILQMPALMGLAGCETYREREFICHLPSYEYLSLLKGGSGFSVGEDDGNGVIIQGAIDLLVVERKDGKAVGAHIIDYKYTAHSDDYVKEKYAPQLALYKCAVSKIYGIEEDKVKTTILNIRACRQIEM